MSAWLFQTLPVLAVIGFLAAGAAIALRTPAAAPRGAWVAPAALSGLLLAWSAFTMVREGPLGFWTEHVRGAWGNQIWLDLLLAVGAGFALLAPRASAAGMRPARWFAVVACSGSVGLLAMWARLLFLQDRAAAGSQGAAIEGLTP